MNNCKSLKSILLGLLFFTLNLLNAQILNIESLRKSSDEAKWSGAINLNVQLIENKNSFVLVSNRTRLQYKKKKDLYMFINDYNFKESNNSKIVSKGIQHVRYNRKLSEIIRIEGFAQNQFDEISKIKYRRLVGSGLRYKLNTSDNYRFYAGTAVMHEWEYIRSDIENVKNKDFRLSNYFSFSLFPKDGISIVSTTYYQPSFSDFGDFRIANDSKIVFKIIKNLAFNVQFSLAYDKYPALGIPKSQYKLTNGITYTF